MLEREIPGAPVECVNQQDAHQGGSGYGRRANHGILE